MRRPYDRLEAGGVGGGAIEERMNGIAMEIAMGNENKGMIDRKMRQDLIDREDVPQFGQPIAHLLPPGMIRLRC